MHKEPVILFVCEHGAAKSVIAATHFNRLAEEAGLQMAIAAMPLAPGYRTTLRTAETGMQQRIRYWSLQVAGEESVTVPAGTFQTYKVVVEPIDDEGGGMTFWVSKDAPRVIVKGEAKLPAMMGGGTATSVLTGRS